MTWNSENHRWRAYEDWDISEEVGSCDYSNNKNKFMFNSHNIKMLGGFAIVFIIAGLQALKGYSIPWGSSIDGIVAFLLFLEHAFYGKTE